MDRRWIASALLILAGAAAYHNSFQGAFLMDDFRHIVENDRIRDLSHPLRVLSGTTRPLVAFTFALNNAAGGLNVWGYHAVNLSIHLAAALTLLALLLRHLKPETALFISLIWLVHPLQTQAVNYIVQRSELLMGLLCLLTLYFLGRCAQTPGARRMKILCVACCALGMAGKPIMAMAPLLALLYDRFFLAPSWREVGRRRGRLHLALLATYGVLAACLLNGPEEYVRDVGFHLETIRPEDYFLNQGKVILHYLRLTFWPRALVFDYGWPAEATQDLLLPWMILLALLAAAGWAARNRPGIGFLGIWFFLTLAPTSLLIPLRDLAFEHRMYLALAAPAVLFVLAVDRLIRSRPVRTRLLAGVILALGIVTVQRNNDYRSAVALWKDTVSKRPLHTRAQANLGTMLHMEGRIDEAAVVYRTALGLDPDLPDVHSNLGRLLEDQGDLKGAQREFEEALRLEPNHPKAAGHWARLLRKISTPS